MRKLIAPALVAVGLVVFASPALAHVSVNPSQVSEGSYAKLTFRVPNESGTSGTVTVEVTLPQDTPLLYVSNKPLPGWTATVTEQPLPAPVTVEGTTLTKAPRTVTWQAQPGTRIDPGQYQDFDISVGPLPAAGSVPLPAVQTYSDGTVVHWDQPTPAGGAEPEHPAPALVVTAAGGTAGATDPVARVLAGAALLVAVVGAFLAVTGRRRTRMTSS